LSKQVDFNGIAPFYDWLSKIIFGKQLLRASECFINQLPETGNVLYIGGGSGILLNNILEDKPKITIDFVEKSEKFIAIAKQNLHLKYLNQVNFVHGTENDLPLKSAYQAIITFFIIDLFSEQKAANFCKKIDVHLLPNGIWLLTDFVATNNIFTQWLLKLMYFFFKLVANVQVKKLPNYDLFFEQFQYTKLHSKFFYFEMISAFIFVKSHSLDKKA